MPDPLTGTVTFLLTDVEGSTRLWERDSVAMQSAIELHDALIRTSVEQHGGTTVRLRGEGDSSFSVFAGARDGVAAACAIQRAMLETSWPTPSPLRIRAALHTGEVNIHAGDFYGTTVNRCARMRDAAHAGQVLLSSVTADLVRDHLPAGVSLRDLGEYGLTGLSQADHIFQIVQRGQVSDFPPLRSPARRTLTVPMQPTPLIGRAEELRAARDLLAQPDVRLLTLTGHGGSGKTRLAVQLTADVAEELGREAYFVSLESVLDADLLLPTVAHTIGVREVPGRPVADTLHDALSSRTLLLVLDNFEQILPAAPQVVELLAACPGLQVLVTSRAPLQVRGEREFPVSPLAVPEITASLTLERLIEYPATALFVAQARAAAPDFDVTPRNAQAIAEICQRLDGLPLGIELAAARVRLLTPEEMLARLERGLPLLADGARDLPARHRTLRDTIAWSYDLLAPHDQAVLRRLGVFVGGCTLEAVESICASGEPGGLDGFSGAEALLRMSLIHRQQLHGGEPRLGMLEAVRAYAVEQLSARGEVTAVRRRHAELLLSLAQTAEPYLQGADQEVWLTRLGQEHDNFRAAMAWAKSEDGDVELGLRLSGTLGKFWEIRGHFREGRDHLMTLLGRSLDQASDPGSSPASTRTVGRAKALTAAGRLLSLQGDAEAIHLLEEAVDLARDLEQTAVATDALAYLGIAVYYQGDSTRARTLLQESLASAQQHGDRFGSALALAYLGNVAHIEGDEDQAWQLHQQAWHLRQALGDQRGVALSCHALGMIALSQEKLDDASALLEESLTRFRDLDERRGLAMALSCLGDVDFKRGALDESAQLQRESLLLRRELGDRLGASWCLIGLAAVAAEQGHLEYAACLLGAASAFRELTGAPLSPANRDAFALQVDDARARLGDGAFEPAWAAGQAMTVEQVTTYALQEASAPTAARRVPTDSLPSASRSPLTEREYEVADLVAKGYSNRQIAEALTVSERTAETHLSHILSKLGFVSRAQIATWVTTQKLNPEE